MALQFWFPFTDGTIENKGICQDELIVETTPLFKDFGKTGKKSFRYGQVKMKAATTAKILNRNTFSFACWVYPNAETGDKTNRCPLLFGNDPMGENNNRKYSIFNYPSCNDLHFSWQNDDGTTYYGSGVWYGVFPSYQWTHLAVTYDNKKYCIYINGELLQSDVFANANTSATFAYDTYLFRNPATNDCFYMNDYRVYDNCLSAAEVREISQGLVLHYKLDNDGFGKENLLPCGGTYTRNSPWTTSLNRTDGFNWVTNSAFEATPSTTYTISVECDGNLAPSHDTGGLNPEDKKWTLWLYICNTDTNKTWNNNAYDTPVNLNSNNNNYRKIGNTHVWTYTLSSTQKYISVRTNSYSDGETVLTLHWWNFKIEEGSEFTPWIPNSSSALYKNLGLDKKIVIDSSGYGRHGKVEGTIQFSTDTPKYTNSYVMDGSHLNRIHYDESTFNYTDNFSYALWVKANHTGDAAQYVFTNGRADTGGYGYGIQNSDDTGLNCRFGNKSYRINIVKNEWTHVAFTKSGTSIKLYKNGELYSSYTFDGTLPTYSDGKGLGLGNFHYLSDIYPAYGNISDFRIYCTALSANAIKDIYRTSLKIDKDGKDHSFEFIEDDSINITSSGKMIAPCFIESKHNFYTGKDFSYTPTYNKVNSTSPYVGIVDLSPIANINLPIRINIEFDFSWENFAFLDVSETLIQEQGASRKKEDGTFTWTNGLVGVTYLTQYITSTSGTAHVISTKTLLADRLELLDGFQIGLRCDYSDGNGTLTLSNIKVTLADDKTKFTKSYISANEFIEK